MDWTNQRAAPKVKLSSQVTVAPVMRGQYSVSVAYIVDERMFIGPLSLKGETTHILTLKAVDARAWARAVIDRLLDHRVLKSLPSAEWSALYLALPHLPKHLKRLVLKEARRRIHKLQQTLRRGEKRWDRTYYDRVERFDDWSIIFSITTLARERLMTIGDIVRNLDRYARHNYFPDVEREVSLSAVSGCDSTVEQ